VTVPDNLLFFSSEWRLVHSKLLLVLKAYYASTERKERVLGGASECVFVHWIFVSRWFETRIFATRNYAKLGIWSMSCNKMEYHGARGTCWSSPYSTSFLENGIAWTVASQSWKTCSIFIWWRSTSSSSTMVFHFIARHTPDSQFCIVPCCKDPSFKSSGNKYSMY